MISFSVIRLGQGLIHGRTNPDWGHNKLALGPVNYTGNVFFVSIVSPFFRLGMFSLRLTYEVWCFLAFIQRAAKQRMQRGGTLGMCQADKTYMYASCELQELSVEHMEALPNEAPDYRPYGGDASHHILDFCLHAGL